MAIHWAKWIADKFGGGTMKKINVEELQAAAEEVSLRELAFAICVNIIAAAIGRCEFKTFRDHREVREQEYYLWNVEPNQNENSTAFLHRLVGNLLTNNAALAVTVTHGGQPRLIVADSFDVEEFATQPNKYTDIARGTMQFRKTYREPDVLHFTLNHIDVKPVLDAITASYGRLAAAARKAYRWDHGKHWKVHVDQMAIASEDWEVQFAKMIKDNMSTFFEADAAVLPEFDGYKYEDVGAKDKGDTNDLRKLADDIFAFTAKAFLIPPVLFGGEVAGTADAMKRWLTTCIDPLCDQMQEEINRKRYGYDDWSRGNFLQIDTSTLIHFDMFENAGNIEKLIGSGVFSVNDVLTAAGRAIIDEPWAYARYMTKNFTAAGNLLAETGGEQ